MTIQELLQEQHILKVKSAYLAYQLHCRLIGIGVMPWGSLSEDALAGLVDRYFHEINHPENETDTLGLFMRAHAQAAK